MPRWMFYKPDTALFFLLNYVNLIVSVNQTENHIITQHYIKPVVEPIARQSKDITSPKQAEQVSPTA